MPDVALKITYILQETEKCQNYEVLNQGNGMGFNCLYCGVHTILDSSDVQTQIIVRIM